jgi:transmembrane sensor
MQNDPAHTRNFMNLLTGFIDNRLNPQELEELFELIERDPQSYSRLMDSSEIKDLLRTKAGEIQDEKFDVSAQVGNRMKERLMSAINSQDNVAEIGINAAPAYQTPVHTMRPRTNILRFRRVAVAAAILIISTGTYFYLQNKNEKPNTVAETPIPTDIKAPQTNRATITLTSGQKVFLDSAANGQLATQNNVKLIKTAEGKIAYDGSLPVQNATLIYNTLTNPKGSRVIDMKLTDGTHVWLNAGSSLTYPVAFAGKERNVEITGEAYFEVARNAAMPFTVKKLNDDTKIQVLGTHFNVNAYDDENAIKVTLLEGSVRVTNGNNKSLLKPGQQAKINDKGIKVSNDVDTEEVMAWKNGKFQFGDASDIATIMRQVSRWYDVDIEYQGNISGGIGGSISRDVNASQVFKMLETTGVVKFKIEGKKVTVMPAAP